MTHENCRELIHRVVYTKQVHGDLIDVTADLFSDGSYHFSEQDRWEVRSQPFEPDPNELEYARKLADLGVPATDVLGRDPELDEALAYEFVAAPAVVCREMAVLREIAALIPVSSASAESIAARVVELLREGGNLTRMWSETRLSTLKWCALVDNLVRAQNESPAVRENELQTV